MRGPDYSLMILVMTSLAFVGGLTGCRQEPVGSAGGSAAQDDAGTADEDGLSGPFGLLISADDLRMRLGSPALRVLDVRPAGEYAAGHIPGAIHVDADAWRKQALQADGLTDAAAWSELVSAAGIDASTPVVVYSAGGGDAPQAARIWWTLKYVGVAEAAILDGGWQAWQSAGGEVSQDPPTVARTEFTPEFQSERLVLIGDLKAGLEEQRFLVVDSRTAAEFTGAGGPGQRKGRVPGAKHIEWTELLDAEGRFLPADELRQLFESRGVSPDGPPAVTYCQSGGRASLDAFALELAGYENVKNYYCSWQEWAADTTAPVEKDE